MEKIGIRNEERAIGVRHDGIAGENSVE